jgi:hypothetical protein
MSLQITLRKMIIITIAIIEHECKRGIMAEGKRKDT